MARGIARTELLELLAGTVNNENPMLHLMEFFLGHLMEAEVVLCESLSSRSLSNSTSACRARSMSLTPFSSFLDQLS